MNFLNRLTLLYTFIVLAATAAFYYLFINHDGDFSPAGKITTVVLYLAVIFISALVISMKDESENYAGFKFHLITYVIVNGTSLLLVAMKVIDRSNMYVTFSTMLTWGVGLAFHLGMYLFMFRKKKIGKYEKEDIFK